MFSVSFNQWFKVESALLIKDETNEAKLAKNNEKLDSFQYIWVSILYVYDPYKLLYETFNSYLHSNSNICELNFQC